MIPKRQKKIIYTCCVLHNMCIQAGLPLPAEEYNQEAAVVLNDNEENIGTQNWLHEERVARDNYIANMNQ